MGRSSCFAIPPTEDAAWTKCNPPVLAKSGGPSPKDAVVFGPSSLTCERIGARHRLSGNDFVPAGSARLLPVPLGANFRAPLAKASLSDAEFMGGTRNVCSGTRRATTPASGPLPGRARPRGFPLGADGHHRGRRGTRDRAARLGHRPAAHRGQCGRHGPARADPGREGGPAGGLTRARRRRERARAATRSRFCGPRWRPGSVRISPMYAFTMTPRRPPPQPLSRRAPTPSATRSCSGTRHPLSTPRRENAPSPMS